MPSDQLVDAKVILEAIAELKRRGINPVMEELESLERELASFLIEELSLIHHTLLQSGAKAKIVRRLNRQAQSAVLVTVLSLRKAHYRLWQESVEGTPLARLNAAHDPSLGDPRPPPSP